MSASRFVVFSYVAIFANLASANPPLLRAIERGDLPFVASANHSAAIVGSNALLHALNQSQYQIAMLLLEKGARTDVEEDNGDTPLIVAIKNHLLTKHMLEKLLANGATLEHVHQKTGMTALMYGAQVGFINGMKLLSDFGASLDRINMRDNKGALDYATDPQTVEFLMKSHRYIGKSLARFDLELLFDENGYPKRLAMGADGVLYWVKQGTEKKIAKFCYVRELFLQSGVIEYRKCREKEDQMAKLWQTWFDNKLEVLAYDVFFLKPHIRGKTLAQWMVANDPDADFGANTPRSALAREKLKTLIIRMLSKGQGFVGDLNPSNLIFSESDQDWVVIDGHKAIACYSPVDHEWIWLEYCQAAMSASKENLLKAFQSYAVGPSPTTDPGDAESFGVWLMSRLRNGVMEGPTPMVQEKMIQLIRSIQMSDLSLN